MDGNSCTVLVVDTQNDAITVENILMASQKAKCRLPHDPAVQRLGRYPKEFKAGTQTNICMPMS